jgi:hypothetical protein
VDYIVNYRKWNALFEQDELNKKKPLDQDRAEYLNRRSNAELNKMVDYVKTDKSDTSPGIEAFNSWKNKMWVMVYGQIFGTGVETVAARTGEWSKNYLTYFDVETQASYPFYTNFKNLKIPQEWTDQSIKLFNQRYWEAFNKKVQKPEWVKYIVDEFNDLFGSSQDKPSETVKSIQSYIKSKLQNDPKLKGYVKNNGTVNRDFVDGVWGPVSATAWLMFSKTINPSDTFIDIVNKGNCKTTSTNAKTPDTPIDGVLKIATAKTTNSTEKPANATAKTTNATAQKTVTPAVKK